MKICINNNDNRLLNQDLKNHDVFSWTKVKKAKGEIRIITLIRTYLSEYEKTRLKSPKETKLFKRPFNEKILKEVLSIEIILFISVVKPEKHMLLFKICSPISLIAEDIRELISKICSQTKYEELIVIAISMVLNINDNGEICELTVRCDTKRVTA